MSALTSASGEEFARTWGKVITSLPNWAAGLESDLREVYLARQGVPTKRKALSENAVKALTALYQEYGGVSAQADRKSPALA
ncbi:hypothetical protein C0V97_03935 [Asaia sp. W19]|uniref:hypothetical protein n=1 Tax=unclassified Asaia TaxID=2685023 RepID=UPI000F8F11E6|nr:hypothetical protein [Asaia sp. W19]RUT26838.1 hypothetical protein C0V97_03935 [Asaia sp. W19]